MQAYQAYINQLEASGLTTQQSYGVAAANFTAALLGVVPSSLKSAASIPGFTEQQNTAQIILLGVTSDGATVTGAKSQINAAASTTPPTLSDITHPGPPLTLTPGIDTLTVPTAGAVFSAFYVVVEPSGLAIIP